MVFHLMFLLLVSLLASYWGQWICLPSIALKLDGHVAMSDPSGRESRDLKHLKHYCYMKPATNTGALTHFDAGIQLRLLPKLP